jgi:UDP-N-acetylmuramoylalanine-D-glutamate ligase
MPKTTQREKLSRIAILGFGIEGKSLLRFLPKSPAYKQSELWILDKRPIPKEEIPAGKNIHLQTGKDYLKNLDRFDALFRSPGIPYLTQEIQDAKKAGTLIPSATKLFFGNMRLFPTGKKRPILIGVTGTKGKGTTCTLLAHILKTAGKKVVLAGNIGKPMLDVLPQAKRADYVVLELSSFQLQDIAESPHIAVVLDIFPDHLDAHKSLEEYFEAKSNIARFQSPADRVFYFSNNPLSKRIAAPGKGRKIAVTPSEESLKKNFEMASAVARSLMIPQKTIDRAIASFKGLEHRLQLVRKLHGVRFYNDSAATNPEAAAAAVRTFKEPLILIAGGKDKGLDYTSLAETLNASDNLATVILFGENREKIAQAIEVGNKKYEIRKTKTLKEAFKLAHAAAESLVISYKSLVVLFSPAAASFDQFKNYKERGETFTTLVKELK